MFWMLLLIILLVFVVFLKIYCVVTLGKCYSTRKLNGKVALVTGSNRGLGYYTALNLAKRGARVIITSEDLEDLKQSEQQMIKESGNKDIIAKHLDFLSLSGVRSFAQDILDTEPRLDILVNNAGSGAVGYKDTKDGLMPGMQINYFGPFLLTNLLLGLLKKSAPSRVVNVASAGANLGLRFDSHNINNKNLTNTFLYVILEYCNSKICVAHSTIEMAKRLKGTGITVNCLHPGAVYTKLFQRKNWISFIAELGRFICLKAVKDGAETTIHLAGCEKAEGITGKYFRDCRPSWIWTDLSAATRNRVWEQSVKLVGLKPEEMII